MTIESVRLLKCDFLTAKDIASILQCDPQSIRTQARRNPKALGFPVIVTGRRIRIPRKPFLA